MKKKRLIAIIALVVCTLLSDQLNLYADNGSNAYLIDNGVVAVGVDAQGRLTTLRCDETGLDYAGMGYLWRLYYDTHESRENQVCAEGQTPSVSMSSDVISISYDRVISDTGRELPFSIRLDIYIDENNLIRFDSHLENGAQGTIIREFQYPLVGNMNTPRQYKLLTTETGGALYDDFRNMIVDFGIKNQYMGPNQKFRQFSTKYPSKIVKACTSNCFAFVGEEDGVYFGSHDLTFQDTWHGFRMYPDPEDRQIFNRLEAGFYKYPQIMCGEKWDCTANCIRPYKGTWHETARTYRAWADTWYRHDGLIPQKIQQMNGWQRIILKHQYGQYLYHYDDINGRIKNAGESVGCNTVLCFGWWKEGMDNGYPAYSPDDTQGGDEALCREIEKFVADGGNFLLYFNGKLIDRQSDYCINGDGKKVCMIDNTGSQRIEQYKFTAEGTFMGAANSRSFIVADTRNEDWIKILLAHADRAISLGASGVFYDQLGYAEEVGTWDVSGEFPVMNVCAGHDKAEVLRRIREHVKAVDPEFSLGTEFLTDLTFQYCDFVHAYPAPGNFTYWFRYAFPEIKFSDREQRDAANAVERVNENLVKGLVNDLEIYRCRGLIDEIPEYQDYLSKINKIRNTYSSTLLSGRFNDCFGFTCSNRKVEAKSFVTWDEEQSELSIVCVNQHDGKRNLRGKISVPGYEYVSSMCVGKSKVSSRGSRIFLGKNGVAVLHFKKAVIQL